jgi:NADPH-dependent 2,4-dienoyl-CoA reductase/sulfur reductase-like enzyme
VVLKRLVVVGASLAGIRAVEAARKTGYDGSVTLVGAEPHPPYDRPPLSKSFLEEEADGPGAAASTRFRAPEYFREELNVDLRLGTPATGLDTEAGSIAVGDQSLDYSELIVATGASPRMLPGAAGLAGVHALRTADDAERIRDALHAGARTVVVGAGFIGSEIASAARKRGLPVTIVETQPVPLVRSVGEETGQVCAAMHRENGTELLSGVQVSSVRGNEHVEEVVLDDGTVLRADLVVVGMGAVPSTRWLQSSDLRLHERDGGVICDETLRAAPGVYAAGDVAHWPNPLFDGELMRLEHWTNAAEQGALAARNALGMTPAKPAAAVPYFWSDWYGNRIQFVGIPNADEVRVVSDELGHDRFLALYRNGDRITGALTINRPTQIMKYRRMIANRTQWHEALAFAGVG